MTSQDPRNPPDKIAELRQQAAVSHHILEKKRHRFRLNAAPVTKDYRQFVGEFWKQPLSTARPEVMRPLLEALLSIDAQRKQLEPQVDQLDSLFMRLQWHEARSIRQRAVVFGTWVPYWSRRMLLQRPKASLRSWVLRYVFQLIRKR